MAHSFGHQNSGKGVGVIIGLAALVVGALSLAFIFNYYDVGLGEESLFLFSAIGSALAGIMLIISSLKSSHF
jgi:hypothetical protein